MPLLIGPSLVAAACLLLGHLGSEAALLTRVIPAILLLGIGLAFCITPITELALAAAAPNRAGIASGVNNAVARVASALAIAALGAILTFSFDQRLAESLRDADANAQTIAHYVEEKQRLALARAPQDLPPQRVAVFNAAVQDAFLHGFRVLCYLAALLALMTAVICRQVVPVEVMRPSK